MSKINRFTAVLFLLFCSINTAFAIDIPDTMRETMAKETVGMPSLLNLVVSMVLVILMIYFTGWVYNKLNIINRNKLKKMAGEGSDVQRFSVLQSMPLGQQRHIYSIEMCGKILLIGSTPGHINLLKEFDKAEVAKEPLSDNSHDDTDNAKEQIKGAVNIDELYKKYKN